MRGAQPGPRDKRQCLSEPRVAGANFFVRPQLIEQPMRASHLLSEPLDTPNPSSGARYISPFRKGGCSR